MRACVCFTCPLSSSHQSDLTFSSTKRNTESELPQFIDVATQMPSPWISCDMRSSQLKIPQGLGRVPTVHLTQKPSAELLWLRYIRLSFQKAPGGMDSLWMMSGWQSSDHVSHIPPQSLGKMEHIFLPQTYPPWWCLVGVRAFWGCLGSSGDMTYKHQ